MPARSKRSRSPRRAHDERWQAVRADAAALAADDDPAAPLAAVRAFLKEFPDTPKRDEAFTCLNDLKRRDAVRRSVQDRRFVDELELAESLPNAELRDLVDRACSSSPRIPTVIRGAAVEAKLELYVRTLDDRDIDRVALYSRQYPTNFATRIERYQDYLREHATGGRHVSEAAEAKDRILREWDAHAYGLAYDHLAAHPDDVAETARRLRNYLRDHRDGRYANDAQKSISIGGIKSPFREIIM